MRQLEDALFVKPGHWTSKHQGQHDNIQATVVTAGMSLLRCPEMHLKHLKWSVRDLGSAKEG